MNEEEKKKIKEENNCLSKKIADESIILLKNDGTLPFSKNVKRIALFGNGATMTRKGGSGSSDVNCEHVVSVFEALKNGEMEIVTEDILKNYEKQYSLAVKAWQDPVKNDAKISPYKAILTMLKTKIKEPDFEYVTEESVKEITADAAIFVIFRESGEGHDRKLCEGEYFLTKTEKAQIDILKKAFSRFILVLNTGGQIDITDLKDDKDVNAILQMYYAGERCGEALFDVITGRVCPSGRLSYTWAKSYEDYPSAELFLNEGKYQTTYKEGIFVGYRHFEKENIEPLFPFGFGKSYASFDIKASDIKCCGDGISLNVTVKNKSENVSAKDVVFIFAKKPQGSILNAKKDLVGFFKTKNLAPNESQTENILIKKRDLAFFDCEIDSWHVAGGKYKILIGENATDAKEWFSLTLDDEIIEFKGSKKERKNEKTLSLSDDELISVVVGSGYVGDEVKSVIGNSSKSVPGAGGETTMNVSGLDFLTMADGPCGIRITPVIYKKGDALLSDPNDDPTKALCYPDEMKKFDKGGATEEIRFCTAFPSPINLASTFNLALLEEFGKGVAKEMEMYDIDIWLAPALNIQRNPLCGRNFEYFSEDPFVSGKCAASVVNGVQKSGKICTIKHFAANNKEENRNYNNSILDKRTLFEIYLKGFEICIEEANPKAIMSAYNLLNGTHCANSKELLSDTLREKFGFFGVVMTDWGTTVALTQDENRPFLPSDPACCIKAGNDLIMPGCKEDFDGIKSALNDKTLTRNELEMCASRIINLIEEKNER